ncbi:unnamed protein product [Calypogeia fissa]
MEFEPKVDFESDYEEEEDPQRWHQRRQLEPNDLRLYLIRRTVLQMLRDRGYQVGDMEIAMSREDFWQKFGNNIKRPELETVRPKIANPTDQIFVFFPEEAKVGVTVIKRYAEIMKEHKVKLAILVLQRKLTLYGRQSISEMSGKYRIEVFQEAELLVNIKDSVLVPEHHVLTDDEKKTIMASFNASSAQMPRLLEDDPVARYFGLKKGQMVKIVRRGQNAADSDSVSYRLLV